MAPDVCKEVEGSSFNDDHEVAIPRYVRKKLRQGEGALWKTAFKEVFSPPQIAELVAKKCLRLGDRSSCDKRCGWDVFNRTHRNQFWEELDRDAPLVVVILEPECKAFSTMMSSNWYRMDPEEAKKIQMQGMLMLHF